MSVYLLALMIGIVAGLRTMTAPALVAWAARLGWLDLKGTWIAFLSNVWACWILTLLAVVELVTDQLPSTPSRTVPVQFGARIATGALSGAAIGAASGTMARRTDCGNYRRGHRHAGRTRLSRAARKSLWPRPPRRLY